MDVLMPQLGETVAEGKITKWFKSAGDAVKHGDNLFEIETDKVSMEVPSIAAGTLSEIRVQVGAVAPVGAVVAIIAGEGAPTLSDAAASGAPSGLAASKPAFASPASKQTSSVPARAETQGHERNAPVGQRAESFAYKDFDPFFEVRTPAKNHGPANVGGTAVTPLARRLAGENSVDLSRVKGSGPRGRIVAADIEAAITSGVGRGVASPAMTAGMSGDAVRAQFRGADFEEVPVDGMRATIARRLVEAKQTVPHFYLTADVSLDALMKLRELANAGSPKEGPGAFKLSVNDFVIKALALALQRVPAANAVWAGDHILRFKHSDVGVAVAIEGGLLTPVVRNAEMKSLSAISAEMKDFAARAKDKKLKPAEYQGGTAAISNLGMYGVREFAAIINPPHATILAVGAAQRRPVEADDGSVKFESQMTVTLSCDHRVVDGALGAQLLAAFKSLIESPVLMLV